jgi:hypothetical protein
MAVVTLSFIASEDEISSGIPKQVVIETSIVSTVYYTLDGTEPSIHSTIYVDPINMPDGMDSVTLSAFGVDGNDFAGPILTQVFSPDITRATTSRYTGLEGFVLDRADSGPDIVDRYGPDGQAATFLDVDPETLQMKHSEKGFDGVAEGTVVKVNYPDPKSTDSLVDDGFVPFSTPEIGHFFNPTARMILIDNRQYNELHLTLRPFGSLENVYTEFGGKRVRESADSACYVSGGFVRRFYDTRNKVMVSYYFDHNESRWVKNIQELPDNIRTNTSLGVQPNAGPPLVFQWIYRGRQSSI